MRVTASRENVERPAVKNAKVERCDGATLVEFALILPAFLLLLFGVLYFGIYLFTQQSVRNAAQQGANAIVVVDIDSADSDTVLTQVNARVAYALSFMPGHIGSLESGSIDDGRCGSDENDDAPGFVCVTESDHDQSYDAVVRLRPNFSSLWPGFPDLLPFLTGGDAESDRLVAQARVRLTSGSQGGG